jgi:pseudouridine-5'-monophosphatase
VRLRRPITHAIFDMDGVLLDTEKFYTAVTQQIVGRFGKTFEWSVKGNMVGRPALESARYLVEALALPITAEQYLSERRALLEKLAPTAEALPGARALTEGLAARGIGLAVATSTERRLYELKITRHHDWFALFGAVIVGDDPRLERGKPAPDIFLLAAADLAADPAACVVVEDAPAGVLAAHAAGMQVIAVPDPAMDRTRFAAAELTVASLLEVRPDDLAGAR